MNLFTRPRRFGKTLNMSMLRSFFEIGTDRTLFDGLAISQETALCEAYMGKFPVIFLSLKGVDGLTFEDAYERLRFIIRAEMSRLGFLLQSTRVRAESKRPLERFLNEQETKTDVVGNLNILSHPIYEHYGQKVILIVDEYDVPLNKAHHHRYCNEMVDLIRNMFNTALKTNDYLYFAVMTGCLRVSKESIFTGLNNPKVLSVVDTRFDEQFGFTSQDVRQLLEDYGLSDHFGEIRE